MKLYLARDKNRLLYLFKDMPIKDETVWNSHRNHILLGYNLFPEVKWEDEEPTEVELVIKK